MHRTLSNVLCDILRFSLTIIICMILLFKGIPYLLGYCPDTGQSLGIEAKIDAIRRDILSQYRGALENYDQYMAGEISWHTLTHTDYYAVPLSADAQIAYRSRLKDIGEFIGEKPSCCSLGKDASWFERFLGERDYSAVAYYHTEQIQDNKLTRTDYHFVRKKYTPCGRVDAYPQINGKPYSGSVKETLMNVNTVGRWFIRGIGVYNFPAFGWCLLLLLPATAALLWQAHRKRESKSGKRWLITAIILWWWVSIFTAGIEASIPTDRMGLTLLFFAVVMWTAPVFAPLVALSGIITIPLLLIDYGNHNLTLFFAVLILLIWHLRHYSQRWHHCFTGTALLFCTGVTWMGLATVAALICQHPAYNTVIGIVFWLVIKIVAGLL